MIERIYQHLLLLLIHHQTKDEMLKDLIKKLHSIVSLSLSSNLLFSYIEKKLDSKTSSKQVSESIGNSNKDTTRLETRTDL